MTNIKSKNLIKIHHALFGEYVMSKNHLCLMECVLKIVYESHMLSHVVYPTEHILLIEALIQDNRQYKLHDILLWNLILQGCWFMKLGYQKVSFHWIPK